MKNYNKFIVATLVLAFVVSIPSVTSAENERENNRIKNETKIEHQLEVKSRNHSWIRSEYNSVVGKASGIINWFKNHVGNNYLYNYSHDYDYGNNDSSDSNETLSPEISSITSPTVLEVGETGTWKINASDPQDGNLTYKVDWGESNSLKSLSKTEGTFVQTSTFTHSYTTTGKYKITFTVSNEQGLKTVSTITVKVINSTVKTAPVISDLKTSLIKPTAATIEWKTDLRSNSLVWYDTSSPLNTSVKADIINQFNVINHKVLLNKLTPNTKYYLVVGSTNNVDTTKSEEISFTTPETNSTNPVIVNIIGDTTINTGDTATMTIKAYDPQNKDLTYSVDWGDSSNILFKSLLTNNQIFVQTATLSHTYNNPGTYKATFTVANSTGEKVSSSVNIVVKDKTSDTTNPIISNIQKIVTNSEVTIKWTTNEKSTGLVYYDTNTPIDVNSSTVKVVSDNTLTTNHSIEISDVASNTLYHFIIKSLDASGNAAVSSETVFYTLN